MTSALLFIEDCCVQMHETNADIDPNRQMAHDTPFGDHSTLLYFLQTLRNRAYVQPVSKGDSFDE